MFILPRHMLQQAVAVSVNAKVCSLLQTCHEGEQPGEVIVRLRKQDVLKVQRPSPTSMSTTLFVRLLYACPCQRVSQPHFVSCAAAPQVSRMGDVTLDTGGTKTVSILVCMCTCRAAQCKPALIDACSSVLWCCAHAFRLKRLQALLNRMLSNSDACRQCTGSRLIMHSCL